MRRFAFGSTFMVGLACLEQASSNRRLARQAPCLAKVYCRLDVRAVLWGSRLDLGTPAIGWYFVAFLQADSRGSFASIAAMKDAGGFQARLRAMVAIFARAGDKSANRVIISPPLWRMKYST
jgi:hypothetical protein